MKYKLIFILFFIGLFNPAGVYGSENTHSLKLSTLESASINTPDSLLPDLVDDLTIELWVKPESLVSNHAFVSKWDSDGDNLSFGFRYLSEREVLSFHTSSDGVTPYWFGEVPYSLSVDEWQHLAVSFDRSQGAAHFFVNGVLVGEKSGFPSIIYNSVADLNIGSTQAGREENFNGLIDEVRIWSTTKTAEDILASMFTQVMQDEEGLAARWSLNESLGDSLGAANLISSNVPSFSTDVPFFSSTSRTNLYTQIESPYPSESETAGWADDKFAKAINEAAIDGCETVAKCGCAITSLVMMARESGVTESVEGTDVNPGTYNEWLTENGGYDSYGNVFWERAVDFFGKESLNKIETPFSLFDHRVTVDSEIKSAVEETSKKVLGFHSPAGHYVYLNGLAGIGFSVLDPLWYNTETSNDENDRANKIRDYDDEMQRGVVYEYGASESKSGNIQINLNSPAELLLINSDGLKTGFEDGEVVEQIPESGYVQDEFIQDQLNEGESTHRTKTLVARNIGGIAELQVVGTESGPYTIDIAMYDAEGNYSVTTFSTTTAVEKTDYYVIDFRNGTVEIKTDDEPIDGIDRAVFIALVEHAVRDEKRYVKKFLVRYAHKIFDAIDKDRTRLAKIKLRIFNKLLRIKRINDDDLHDAITQLKSELKNN